MAQTIEKLTLRHFGPHDYGRTFYPDEPDRRIDVRVTGDFVDARKTDSLEHSQWVWSAYLNGRRLDHGTPLARRRDAVELLKTELHRRGVLAEIPESRTPEAAVERSATETLFNRSETGYSAEFKEVGMRSLVQISGTTLVGTVVQSVKTDSVTRLRVEFAPDFFAWVEESVAELVEL